MFQYQTIPHSFLKLSKEKHTFSWTRLVHNRRIVQLFRTDQFIDGCFCEMRKAVWCGIVTLSEPDVQLDLEIKTEIVSNWWTRKIPQASLPCDPASFRKQVDRPTCLYLFVHHQWWMWMMRTSILVPVNDTKMRTSFLSTCKWYQDANFIFGYL